MKSFWKDTNPFSFFGYSSRSEYWIILLLVFIWMQAGLVIRSFLYHTYGIEAVVAALAHFLIFCIAPLWVLLATSVRRTRDTGINPWWLCLWLVPFTIVALIILGFKASDVVDVKEGDILYYIGKPLPHNGSNLCRVTKTNPDSLDRGGFDFTWLGGDSHIWSAGTTAMKNSFRFATKDEIRTAAKTTLGEEFVGRLLGEEVAEFRVGDFIKYTGTMLKDLKGCLCKVTLVDEDGFYFKYYYKPAKTAKPEQFLPDEEYWYDPAEVGRKGCLLPQVDTDEHDDEEEDGELKEGLSWDSTKLKVGDKLVKVRPGNYPANVGETFTITEIDGKRVITKTQGVNRGVYFIDYLEANFVPATKAHLRAAGKELLKLTPTAHGLPPPPPA